MANWSAVPLLRRGRQRCLCLVSADISDGGCEWRHFRTVGRRLGRPVAKLEPHPVPVRATAEFVLFHCPQCASGVDAVFGQFLPFGGAAEWFVHWVGTPGEREQPGAKVGQTTFVWPDRFVAVVRFHVVVCRFIVRRGERCFVLPWLRGVELFPRARVVVLRQKHSVQRQTQWVHGGHPTRPQRPTVQYNRRGGMPRFEDSIGRGPRANQRGP